MKGKHRSRLLIRMLLLILTVTVLATTAASAAGVPLMTTGAPCLAAASAPESTSEPDSTPNSEPEPASTPETEELPDETVPAATPTWALMNLLVVVLCLVMAAFLLFGITPLSRARQDDDGRPVRVSLIWRVLAIVDAIAALVVFLITENLHNPMGIADRWTPLMFIMLLTFLIMLVLIRHERRKEMEDEETTQFF